MTKGGVLRRFWRWSLVPLFVVMAVGAWLGVPRYREQAACERRGAALDERMKRLQADGKRIVIIGTKREKVVQFLETNGLDVSSESDRIPPQIAGYVRDVGCPHIFGCGDEVIIRVAVGVDDKGAAISAPTVEAMYSDCL